MKIVLNWFVKIQFMHLSDRSQEISVNDEEVEQWIHAKNIFYQLLLL